MTTQTLEQTQVGIQISYIRFVDRATTDLLKTKCHSVVVPVNCHGMVTTPSIMAQMRRVAPLWFKGYQAKVQTGEFKPGMVLPCRAYEPQHLILSAAIQDHADEAASVEAIRASLKAIVKSFVALNMTSIALPKLGVKRNGPLSWEEVGPVMAFELGKLPDGTQVEIYIGGNDDEYQPFYDFDGTVLSTEKTEAPARTQDAFLPE